MPQEQTLQFVSKKASLIEPSITIAITALAKKMKAEGKDVLSFSAGEPDFPTPATIAEAGIQAIKDGKTTYTPASGTVEVRKAAAHKIQKELGLSYAPEEIIVSCGAKHSIYNCLLAICDPGDEVLVPSPYWVSYPHQVKLADGVPITIHTDADTQFKLTPDQLKNAITPRTKALILNTPSNPTGSVYTYEEIQALANVIKDHNILVISDEIYAKLVYGETTHTSIATFEGMRDKTLLVDGASKAYAMTGWRIGYTAGPKPIIDAMNRIQSHSTSNPTTPAQWAATSAFLSDDTDFTPMLAEFSKRRDYMVNTLNSIPGISCQEPQGAFYAFPSIEGLLGKQSETGTVSSSFAFCEQLLEQAHVACVPGSAFGAEGYLRMSYATSMEQIEKGLQRLADWVAKLS